MSKKNDYKPLVNYLRDSNKDIIELTFRDIEKILGFPLPYSTRIYRANWSNNERETLARNGWLQAGYESFDVNMEKEIAHFRKMGVFIPKIITNYTYKAESKKQHYKIIEKPEDEILLDVPSNLIELENDEYLMVKLSKHNSNIVEEELENDPAYRHIGKKAFDEMYNKNDYSKEAYVKVINKIATENSTRTSKNAMNLLADYCSNINNKFLERLKEGNPVLVDDLLNYLVSNGERRDKSLVSKICRYMNEWVYHDDAYTINDSVVRKVLPYYLSYYKIDKSIWYKKNLDELSYVEFFKLFNSVKMLLPEMNRHELDHLIWYVYKNDPIRSSIAVALVDVLVREY